jgi:hypothetical protein
MASNATTYYYYCRLYGESVPTHPPLPGAVRAPHLQKLNTKFASVASFLDNEVQFWNFSGEFPKLHFTETFVIEFDGVQFCNSAILQFWIIYKKEV